MGRRSVQIGAAEEAHCEQLLRAWVEDPKDVYRLGTHRRKGEHQGTMQSPGLPDFIAFLRVPPGTRVHGLLSDQSRKIELHLQVKAGEGRETPAQRRYGQNKRAAGTLYLVADYNGLIAWGCTMGYCRADSFPHYRQPQP